MSHNLNLKPCSLESGLWTLLTLLGTIQLNQEPIIRRVYSRGGRSRRSVAFQISVRNRDRKCIFSGVANSNPRVESDSWRGFEAAHVFPMERQTLWDRCGFSRYITTSTAQHPINSVQNGLFISANLHQCFDSYEISVNPDVSQSIYYLNNLLNHI